MKDRPRCGAACEACAPARWREAVDFEVEAFEVAAVSSPPREAIWPGSNGSPERTFLGACPINVLFYQNQQSL
jgi:hypothetical protein